MILEMDCSWIANHPTALRGARVPIDHCDIHCDLGALPASLALSDVDFSLAVAWCCLESLDVWGLVFHKAITGILWL